jgi:hypothetical protein
VSVRSRSLLALLGLLLAAVARAATVYVAPMGEDAHSGLRPELPLRTIQAGVDRLGPGDTPMIRGGVYHEAVTVAHGGADEQHRIIIRSHPDETAVLDGQGVDVRRWAGLVALTGCSYVTLSDVEVRNSAQDGVRVLDGATHIRVDRLNVYDCGGSGLSMWRLGQPAFIYVRDGEYHGNERSGIHAASVLGG